MLYLFYDEFNVLIIINYNLICSPVYKPLLKQKPFLSFWRVHVHVFIQAPHHKHLVVIVDRVSSEELFWLLERAILSLDLICFRIKAEAV
jgi:hypothetical protein